MNSMIKKKETKRSTSILRKLSGMKVKECKWNFAFLLSFREKTYELYAPTRSDRDEWVKTFSTISEMNSKGIKLDTCKPFEYI